MSKLNTCPACDASWKRAKTLPVYCAECNEVIFEVSGL